MQNFFQSKKIFSAFALITYFFKCREVNSVMQFMQKQLLDVYFVACQAYVSNTKLFN